MTKMTMTKLWIPHVKMHRLIQIQQVSLFQCQIIAIELIYLTLAKKIHISMVLNKPDDLDANGVLVDIDVQPIDGASSSNAGEVDIDQFFSAPIHATGQNGVMKEHQKCKICPSAQILSLIYHIG